ncbi:agmatine deiminase family protein [Streptomyces sp. NPDC058000]|uniref:agmatine deiminase family protein n=1 Tax=Streptomyces sp. NPDC058000 TaxID=3346299 RepID=UPI0036EFCDF0
MGRPADPRDTGHLRRRGAAAPGRPRADRRHRALTPTPPTTWEPGSCVPANGGAVVPVGGGERGEEALAVLAAALPGRRVVGVPAPTLAFGGGAHCVIQQLPRAPRPS